MERAQTNKFYQTLSAVWKTSTHAAPCCTSICSTRWQVPAAGATSHAVLAMGQQWPDDAQLLLCGPAAVARWLPLVKSGPACTAGRRSIAGADTHTAGPRKHLSQCKLHAQQTLSSAVLAAGQAGVHSGQSATSAAARHQPHGIRILYAAQCPAPRKAGSFQPYTLAKLHLALPAEEGAVVVGRRHVARAGQRLGHWAAGAAGLRRQHLAPRLDLRHSRHHVQTQRHTRREADTLPPAAE